ncbi:MAG: nickel-responsive transcriptional regulator NikR [Proteobacteria bacterium]|nr:nickel-responsive transcriptional regulator NikR [Pseudomonadota bacterium]
MDRFTISLDERLAAAFDALIQERGYTTCSEAVRDILRTHLQQSLQRRDAKGVCVANLSYVYSHHERELTERLARIQHAHHDLTVATTHAHLDHDQCIESVILKGSAKQVREFADELIAERGVRHGQLNLVSVELGKPHSHGGSTHRHFKPHN